MHNRYVTLPISVIMFYSLIYTKKRSADSIKPKLHDIYFVLINISTRYTILHTLCGVRTIVLSNNDDYARVQSHDESKKKKNYHRRRLFVIFFFYSYSICFSYVTYSGRTRCRPWAARSRQTPKPKYFPYVSFRALSGYGFHATNKRDDLRPYTCTRIDFRRRVVNEIILKFTRRLPPCRRRVVYHHGGCSTIQNVKRFYYTAYNDGRKAYGRICIPERKPIDLTTFNLLIRSVRKSPSRHVRCWCRFRIQRSRIPAADPDHPKRKKSRDFSFETVFFFLSSRLSAQSSRMKTEKKI